VERGLRFCFEVQAGANSMIAQSQNHLNKRRVWQLSRLAHPTFPRCLCISDALEKQAERTIGELVDEHILHPKIYLSTKYL
jgi:hypothetical protein